MTNLFKNDVISFIKLLTLFNFNYQNKVIGKYLYRYCLVKEITIKQIFCSVFYTNFLHFCV